MICLDAWMHFSHCDGCCIHCGVGSSDAGGANSVRAVINGLVW